MLVALVLLWAAASAQVLAPCVVSPAPLVPPPLPTTVIDVVFADLLACRCPCNDFNPCTSDACDPKLGCIYTPLNCNDNDECTVDGPCDPTTPTGCSSSASRRQTCCPVGYAACDNPAVGGIVCADLSSNSANCGACNVQCAADRQCVGGLCVSPCPPGFSTCQGRCVNLSVDWNNCGACGVRCPLCRNATCPPQ